MPDVAVLKQRKQQSTAAPTGAQRSASPRLSTPSRLPHLPSLSTGFTWSSASPSPLSALNQPRENAQVAWMRRRLQRPASLCGQIAAQRRLINQDACAALPEIGAFIVCDGMGGAAAGEVASQLATEAFLNCLASAVVPPSLQSRLSPPRRSCSRQNLSHPPPFRPARRTPSRSSPYASRRCHPRCQPSCLSPLAQVVPVCNGMGTTLVALLWERSALRRKDDPVTPPSGWPTLATAAATASATASSNSSPRTTRWSKNRSAPESSTEFRLPCRRCATSSRVPSVRTPRWRRPLPPRHPARRPLLASLRRPYPRVGRRNHRQDPSPARPALPYSMPLAATPSLPHSPCKPRSTTPCRALIDAANGPRRPRQLHRPARSLPVNNPAPVSPH